MNIESYTRNEDKTGTVSSTEIIIKTQKVTVTQESLFVSSQASSSKSRASTMTLSQYKASAPNIAI